MARAVAANPDFSAARKDVDVAAANSERSSALLPSNPYFSGGAQRTSAKGTSANYVFLLSQEFEIAGQRRRRIETAARNVERATWQLKSAEQTLAATVKTAFVHALLSIDRVTVAQQGMDAAAEFPHQLPQSQRIPESKRIDLNVAEIQHARARRDLAVAEHSRDAALRVLRNLIGLPLDQALELAGAPRTEIDPLPLPREIVERALQQRPDLIALRYNAERTSAQLALSERERIPNITLSATVSRFEGDTLAGGDIGFPIPIFHRKAAEVHEAIAERDRGSLQVQDLERTIEQEVLDAHDACVLAAADLQSLRREIVPRSEENYQLERRLYERGTATLAELTAIQMDLVSARREHLDAIEVYNAALVELERVAGGPITSFSEH